MPTIDIRNISGAEAPARLTISPVVKKRLKAGATCATPGMMTPNRPSWPRGSDGRDGAASGTVAMALALSVPGGEVEVGPVELGRVLPDAAVAALGGSPFRARDALVDAP